MKRTPMPPRKKPMRASRGLLPYQKRIVESIARGDFVLMPRQTGRATMARALNERPPVAIPKTLTFRSEDYRRLVATMPCALCGKAGPSQHCHMDLGKGEGIKTDDRLAWPGCADAPLYTGCHSRIGMGGVLKKAMRRRTEAVLVLQTVHELVESGRWPVSVPRLDDARMQELERWAT